MPSEPSFLEAWFSDDLAAMAFPCAVCGVQFSKHGLVELRQCFIAFSAVLKALDEEIARLKAQSSALEVSNTPTC